MMAIWRPALLQDAFSRPDVLIPSFGKAKQPFTPGCGALNEHSSAPSKAKESATQVSAHNGCALPLERLKDYHPCQIPVSIALYITLLPGRRLLVHSPSRELPQASIPVVSHLCENLPSPEHELTVCSLPEPTTVLTQVPLVHVMGLRLLTAVRLA